MKNNYHFTKLLLDNSKKCPPFQTNAVGSKEDDLSDHHGADDVDDNDDAFDESVSELLDIQVKSENDTLVIIKLFWCSNFYLALVLVQHRNLERTNTQPARAKSS